MQRLLSPPIAFELPTKKFLSSYSPSKLSTSTTLSIKQSICYHLQFKVVKPEYFWAVYNNVAKDMQKLLHAIGADVSRRIEKFGLILASTITFNPVCLLGCHRFPYKEKRINQWFEVLSWSEDEQQQQKTVRIRNVDHEGRDDFEKSIRDQTANLPTSNYPFEVFYHGTNHEFAQDIIEGGINLNKGSSAQDFSDGNAFYVGDSFNDCLAWATNMHSGKGKAILVYHVDARRMRGQINGLNLCNNIPEWRKVVKEYRKAIPEGRRKQHVELPDYKYRKNLERQYGFIEGPTSLFRKGKYDPIDNESYQLCVRCNECAEIFNQSLHSVIFFEL